MSKITPCLWFDAGKAEEAATFYTTLFPDSRIDKVVKAAADNPSTPEGRRADRRVHARGRTVRRPSTAVRTSRSTRPCRSCIDCEDQAEVDRYWDALVEGGGEHSVCGWLKDRFGVSWQVVPRQLNEMLESDDRAAAARAMEAMLQMTKIDVGKLREAFEGVPA